MQPVLDTETGVTAGVTAVATLLLTRLFAFLASDRTWVSKERAKLAEEGRALREELQQNLNALRAEMATLKGENLLLHQQVARLKGEIEAMQRGLAEAEERKRGLLGVIDSLRAEIDRPGQGVGGADA